MTGDENPAVFIGTFLQNGEAVALCEQCIAPWAASVFAGVTGADIEALQDLAARAEVQAADAQVDEQLAAAAKEAEDRETVAQLAELGATDALAIEPDPTETEPEQNRNGHSRRKSPVAGTDTGQPDAGPPAATTEQGPAGA
jgi:hypothetical protein